MTVPVPGGRVREALRITASMTVACVLGALILGGVFMVTDRYARAARAGGERGAITDLLSLDSRATVREVRQYLDPEKREVIYRTSGAPGRDRELVFGFDGRLDHDGPAAAADGTPVGLTSLGRMFVATREGRAAGFVVEGEARGYKNIIRFFVALDSSFDIAGVRVVEHEEDPGLGAETATKWFQGQFIGRPAASLGELDVTRDPMPEDWRSALITLDRTPAADWRAAHRGLIERERAHPLYAVTGATISSRALTFGVRTTVDHFRRRWALIAPHLGGTS
jgi:electron transport complex protein RnfG